MGFDVLYLPPIHPIGKLNRKGKNNSVRAQAGEPGSPWDIGSDEGGHKAIHPELGTLEDYKRLILEAKKLNIDIALDLAYQCAPDNPYVKGLIWFVGTMIGVVVGTVSANTYLDSRYMLAAEGTKQFASTQMQIEFSSDKNRKLYIEDQLFKLDQIPESKKTSSERAQASKYKRELDSLNSEWTLKGKPLK